MQMIEGLYFFFYTKQGKENEKENEEEKEKREWGREKGEERIILG